MKIFKNIAILVLTIVATGFFGFGQTPSDACSNALAAKVTVGGCSSTTDWNVGNTAITPNPNTCGVHNKDKWIWFEANTSSTQISFTNGDTKNVQLDIYEMTTLNCPIGTNVIACIDATGDGGNESIVISTTPGRFYFVQASCTGGTANSFLCVSNYTFNNDCATATSLTSNTSCSATTGNITGATESQAGCGGANANDDVWYSFTAVSATQTVQVVGSASFNPVFQLFSGTCGSLTSIQCVNANGTNGGTESQTFTGLAPGNTYYVRVYDFDGDVPATPTFTICVTHSANDYFGTSTGFSMSNNTGCALATYTFNQSTGSTNPVRINPLPKVITINFPSGTNCATATPAGSSFNGTAIPSFTSQTGNTITFNAPVIVGKNTAFTIVIANVTNAASLTSAPASVVAQNEGTGLNVWTGYSVTTTPCPTVPTNNECSTPTSLTPAAAGLGTCTAIDGSTFGATASGQPACAGTPDDDVWYSFVANGTSHQVTVNGDVNFNGVVQVFSGSCAGTLTSIACVNTTGLDGSETANLTGLVSGQTYLVRVYHSLAGFGSSAANAFTICVTSTAPPCNIGTTDNYGTTAVPYSLPITSVVLDNCGGGNDITASNVQVCGSTSYYGGEDNVIVFKPTTSGNISINLTSASSWIGIMLYQGCPTAGGTCVAFAQSSAGNQSIGCAAVIANEIYYLVVDTYPAPSCITSYTLSISAPTGGIPAGTTCSNAVAMTLPYSATGQSTLCYGNDYTNASLGSCGTIYESGEDKVYSFTTTGADCFSLSLSNVSTSSIGFQVYSGCPGVSGTACVANGGGASLGTLSSSFSVPSAGTYYLVVDTWANPSFVNYDIELVSLGGAPSNDAVCNAIPMTVGVASVGDNQCSGNSGEPAIPGAWTATGTYNTVWFSFVATSTSMKVKALPGTLFDPQIAVYSGSCSSLTFMLANNNTGSCGSTTDYSGEVAITTVIGQTYWVRVDGAENATGSFQVIAIDNPGTYPAVQGQDCTLPNPVCNSLMSISNPGYAGLGNTCDFGSGYCLASGERNVVWYTIPITGVGTGTLSFNLVPNDFNYVSEDETDYDFAIWRATSGDGSTAYSCTEISAGTAPPVACNYSGLGITGLGTGGNPPTSLPTTVCPTCPVAYNPSLSYGGAYEPTINTVSGDVYVLAVSNFSNSTSGFRIEFSTTGTATIDYAVGTSSSAPVIWTGGAASPNSNDWTQPANWGGCSTPACGKDATIASFANQPILTAGTYYSKNVTIQPGATLTLQAGAILEVCGNFINYGSINAAPTSTIIMVGSGNQTMLGSFVGSNRLGNLTITKGAASGTVTLMNDLELGGSFTTSNATSIFNSNNKYISVAGHFINNNGDLTFTNVAPNGTLEFNGTSVQYYKQGSSQLNLNNVIINNTGGIGNGVNLNPSLNTSPWLNSSMFISNVGALTLTLGTITTGTNRVDVANTAVGSVSVGNTASFVDGNLRRSLLGAGTYNWPVGNVAKGYQRALTTFASNSNPYVDARFDVWPAGNPIQGGSDCGTTFSLEAMNNGYWTLVGTGAAATYNMSLYPLNVTNAAAGWTIMKQQTYNFTGWLLNGVCAVSTVTQINRNNMTNFSVFGVAQAPTPLPIELLNFDGEIVGEDNLLTWSTASEHNNDYFTLERSRNGVDFEVLAIVQGAGTSTSILHYNRFDFDPYAGISYYRLKQTDFDGQFMYSQTIALNRELDHALVSELFPNPAGESVNFDLNTSKSGNVTVEMYDNAGRLIMAKNFTAHAGSNSYNLEIMELSRGVYSTVILFEHLENAEIRKLIKN